MTVTKHVTRAQQQLWQQQQQQHALHTLHTFDRPAQFGALGKNSSVHTHTHTFSVIVVHTHMHNATVYAAIFE